MEFGGQMKVALMGWIGQDGSVVLSEEVTSVILNVTGDRDHGV